MEFRHWGQGAWAVSSPNPCVIQESTVVLEILLSVNGKNILQSVCF